MRPGRDIGRIPPAAKRDARRFVARAVDAWWDAAYLHDGNGRYAYFTPRTRRQALADSRLMTIRGLAPRSGEPPRAVRRTVVVDLLGSRGRPVAATARFRLGVRVEADRAQLLRVTGQLQLTRTGEGWRVFAYDVAREVGPTTGPKRSDRSRDRKDRDRKDRES